MINRLPGSELLTLEPLIESVQVGIEETGWSMSGLQKTTSTEFDGAWEGESTRSAYLFFHRSDLPEEVSVEGFLDETSDGLRGNLSLVVDGPGLSEAGDVRTLLRAVSDAALETLPPGPATPITLRMSLRTPATPPDEARLQIRFKVTVPQPAIRAGGDGVAALAAAAVAAFERLLERPEVASLLPPVMD